MGSLTLADNALGAFLRARREATKPTEVGLPAGPRRRTPGLRRGELAALAGVSVEYLTRLERGSDRRPSGQVLGALADALGLSPEERVHLHRLTKVGGGELCPMARRHPQTVRPTVRALLDRLDGTPAYLADAQGDLLAWTRGFRLLAAPVGLLDEDPPNLVRFVFTDPRARAVFPDWDRVAGERAAGLRAAADLGDLGAAALAEELSITVGAGFGRRFTAAATLPASTGTEQWEHPAHGPLRLPYERLPIPGTDEQHLVVYLPAGPLSGAGRVAPAGSPRTGRAAPAR